MSNTQNLQQVIADFLKLKHQASITELTDYLEYKFSRKFSQSYLSNVIKDLIEWGIIRKENVPKKNPNKRGGKTYDTILFNENIDQAIIIEEDETELVTLDLREFDNFKIKIEQLITLDNLEQEIMSNDLLRIKFNPRDKKLKDRKSNKTRNMVVAEELLKIIREKLLDEFYGSN